MTTDETDKCTNNCELRHPCPLQFVVYTDRLTAVSVMQASPVGILLRHQLENWRGICFLPSGFSVTRRIKLRHKQNSIACEVVIDDDQKNSHSLKKLEISISISSSLTNSYRAISGLNKFLFK